MQSRPKLERDTALNLLKAVIPEIDHAITLLHDFKKHEHDPLEARNP